MKIEEKPLVEINQDALRVLYKELGPVNATRFLNQYSSGRGDYTEERRQMFKGMTVDDIGREIKKHRRAARGKR